MTSWHPVPRGSPWGMPQQCWPWRWWASPPFAATARGWSLAAAVSLILASPLVAAFSYAVGPYDTQPWWEAISGLLTATAGLCLLAAAAFSGRSQTRSHLLYVPARISDRSGRLAARASRW